MIEARKVAFNEIYSNKTSSLALMQILLFMRHVSGFIAFFPPIFFFFEPFPCLKRVRFLIFPPSLDEKVSHFSVAWMRKLHVRWRRKSQIQLIHLPYFSRDDAEWGWVVVHGELLCSH